MPHTSSCVGVLVGAMPCRGQQLLQHRRVHRRLIGDDLNRRDLGRADGPLEEAAGSPPVTLDGEEDIDDLAELVDGAVDIAPPASDLHIRLIHLPAVPDGVPAGPGGLGEQRREPLHPAVDGDVVDFDAAFGEQFFDVAEGQAETQVPADRQHDHLGREAEASEGRSRAGSRARAAGSHDNSLPTQGSLAADATVPLSAPAGLCSPWVRRLMPAGLPAAAPGSGSPCGPAGPDTAAPRPAPHRAG